MKRFVFALGALVLGALFATNAYAQHGTIIGSVVDQDGQPVEGAVVKIAPVQGYVPPVSAKTKKNGEFGMITTQYSGPWQITVEKPGYMSSTDAQPIMAPIGGTPTRIPPIKLWKEGAAGAPPKPMTKEEAAKAEEERKAMAALQVEFQAAVALLDEAKAAQQANDAALAAQKLDEAEAAYKELLAKRSDLPQIHFNLAVVYTFKKAWDQAGDEYAKAAELKPDWVDAYAGASAAYQNARQPDKAKELLAKGMAAAPDNARLQSLLGTLAFNAGNYAEAETALKRALELDPSGPEPLYYLGTIAISLNKTNEAVQYLEKYVAANPASKENLETAKALIAALKPAKK